MNRDPDRRQTLKYLAGAGLAALVGCGSGSDDDSGSAPRSTTSTTAEGGSIPEETAGPYPGDGSNGPNALTESGVVRQDIRSSFGSASGIADGVPLTVTLALTDDATGAPLSGAAVYIWHCDRDGRYSMYSEEVADENYLRGVQEADSAGQVTFVSIFPACYPGRWPHIHFEVYPSLDEAIAAGEPTVTSQLGFPAETCDEVYATSGYEASIQTFAEVSLDTDMVFSDGYDQQLARLTGNPTSGYTAALPVPI